MFEDNVEIVRNAFAALASGDVNAWVEVLDADIEMPGAVGGLEEGTIQFGRDSVSRELLTDLSVWAERRYELQEVIPADDRVVALVHEHRRGKGSGIDVGAPRDGASSRATSRSATGSSSSSLSASPSSPSAWGPRSG